MTLKVAILAGGLGTRLAGLTASTPKSLVEVNGRSFLDIQLELLAKNNITDVVLCVGHLSERLINHIGKNYRSDLNITLSHDGPGQLGKGGALLSALPHLGNVFFVLYGDSYLPVNFSEIEDSFQVKRFLGLMTITDKLQPSDRPNVRYNNDDTLYYSKNQPGIDFEYLDYGLSIFRREAFDQLKKGTFLDLGSLQEQLSSKSLIQAVVVDEEYFEIGSLSGISRLEQYLKGN